MLLALAAVIECNISIHLHPTEVGQREMPSYWEDDLIKGKNNAPTVGTLVKLSSAN